VLGGAHTAYALARSLNAAGHLSAAIARAEGTVESAPVLAPELWRERGPKLLEDLSVMRAVLLLAEHQHGDGQKE
jgi:predicted ATP-grasp superfamily ATP-dependent carboligase